MSKSDSNNNARGAGALVACVTFLVVRGTNYNERARMDCNNTMFIFVSNNNVYFLVAIVEYPDNRTSLYGEQTTPFNDT